MERFVCQGTPSRVGFEWGGLAALPAELERLGATRALILATPEQRPLADRARLCLARALGGKDASDAGPLLFELNRALGIPAALSQIGMPERGLDEAADLACRNPYANPRPVERGAIRALLQRAWQGAEPA